jgi:hypothetical protein|tara:strand:+ start:15352 stop:15564 length:213 start_codon:yes stop_codon:yes gene_type:complete
MKVYHTTKVVSGIQVKNLQTAAHLMPFQSPSLCHVVLNFSGETAGDKVTSASPVCGKKIVAKSYIDTHFI